MIELIVYGALVFIGTLMVAWVAFYPAYPLIGWVAYLSPFAMLIIAVNRYFNYPWMQAITWAQLLGMYAALLMIGKLQKILSEPSP